MGSPLKLAPAVLYRHCDPAQFKFATTAELPDFDAAIGQERARNAVDFGLGIARQGYNLFVMGPAGSGKRTLVRNSLEQEAHRQAQLLDWVYVNNFATPHRPVAISLPPGRAPALQKAVHDLIDDLKMSLPSVFESEDYQKRRSAIEQGIRSKNERAFTALRDKATGKNIAILRTPMGFAMAPMKDGQVVPPAEFNAWSAERQQEVQASIEELEKDLEETLRSLPRLEREQRDAVRELDRETARLAIAQPIEECRAQFADLPKVLEHLDAIRADLLENIGLFINPQAASGEEAAQIVMRLGGLFDRYEVNVLVSRTDGEAGAPVVEEVHPTLSNLVGRIEYLSVQGALVTNFGLRTGSRSGWRGGGSRGRRTLGAGSGWTVGRVSSVVRAMCRWKWPPRIRCTVGMWI